MTYDDGTRGGYACPVDGCDYTAVVQVLVDDHLRDEHTKKERDATTVD